MRSFLTVVLSMLLIACADQKTVTRAELERLKSEWREPKVSLWYYTGSEKGFHHFRHEDLGETIRVRISEQELPWQDTFPLTRHRKRWRVLDEWGVPLPKASESPLAAAPEHAVLVYGVYSSADLTALYELEDRLEAVVEAASAGEYDGHEISTTSDVTLFAYGPDADALFGAMRPVLEASPVLSQIRVRLRYGSPGDGVREWEVTLRSQ